ncbi:hypothetical protein ABW20_dc0110509 [Dactylellina cionopaga]|nr:hypothetical protein ABW20_dc0110509 [Dactylellina cionopaga]
MISPWFFTILQIFVIWTKFTAAQDQPFNLNFEGPQFQFDQTTGRLEDPVEGFDLSDFSVITVPDIQGTSVSITELQTALLRPCSPNHYAVRIAPSLQDRTVDRGATVGIKIAPDGNGNPGLRSFDVSTICLGCAFIPAATQGMPLPQPIGTDPLTKIIVPASCEITVTGTKYQPPGVAGQKETITAVVKYTARAPQSLANPLVYQTSPMTRFAFSDRWTDLVSLEFKIANAKVGTIVNLPAGFDRLLSAGTIFSSVAVDNFNGTRHVSAGVTTIP